eukprot:CAMPEP_0172185954 /NCGR_PEP_ID=MMETSP1050-20130122/20461_1 /TAXON_ID=233186 /ORGANISM="Cryptomonas curvata, Strain CCAP979/52" /LENGTH=283 /DNA_ID=CAMNT_0012860007 /DNA_START=44 /DNA_END=892 /DNA_ORIENTATION=+
MSSVMARRPGSFAAAANDISRDLVDTTTVTIVKSEDSKFINDYEVIKDLGKGSYGKVKLVRHKETHELFAMKVMNKNVLKKKRIGNRNLLQDVEHEIKVMRALDHPKLIKLYEVIDSLDHHKLFLRLEFVDGGATMPGDTPCEALSEDTARRYFRDLIEGLEYMHSRRIVHRDIKPENLLRSRDGEIAKIADFGTGTVLPEGGDDTLVNSAGTPAFTAPEACVEGGFGGFAADVWAAGVSLYLFTHGQCPFMAANLMNIYQLIREQEPEYSPSLSADCRDLLS